MLDSLRQDLRHGVRMLRKNPGFAAAAVVSIAIGVGANAAMFSLADGLVLRPLPVPRAGDVVTIFALAPGAGFRNPLLSYPEYLDVRDQSRSFEGLVAYNVVVTSFAGHFPWRMTGMAASFFPLLVLQSLLIIPYSYPNDIPALAGMPWLSSLHVLNALFIFWLAFQWPLWTRRDFATLTGIPRP